MYLARKRINAHQTRFLIRHSFPGPNHMISRDLFDLGSDPTQFILYPGGNGYYFDPSIEDALQRQGLEVNQSDLDVIFFEFLRPEIQRVIAGFDRRCKGSQNIALPGTETLPHIFDRRRYHFLRFGGRTDQRINQVPKKFFRPLMNKSRDEIEQYFLTAEKILRPNEIFNYTLTIFELKSFAPDTDSGQPPTAQLDACFMDQLSRLNSDSIFLAGVPEFQGLYEYLAKYKVMYFDSPAFHRISGYAYIEDFISSHRAYRPPPKVRIKIQEAEELFGRTWLELKGMDRAALTRRFRQLALKYHPDHGGDADTFLRLANYYQALLRNKK
jgi:hypothetical protein